MTSAEISVSVRDAAALTGLSEYELRNSINKGTLAAQVSDTSPRFVICTPDLTRYVESLPLASSQAEESTT